MNPVFHETLLSIRGKPYEQGFSLPGIFYTDPDWLRRECETLFARDWVCVGRVEEVGQPGDYFSFDLVGEPIVVVRGRDRQIPIPFGPYLAVAGLVALIWGEQINRSYLQLAGLA